MSKYRLMDKIAVTRRIDHFPVIATEEINKLFACENSAELMLEAVSIEDIDATYHLDFDPVDSFYFEAITTTTNRIERTMRAFGRAFDQQSAGTGITVENVEVGKPRKSGAIAIVTAKMTLSDGQTISVVFHNPDKDPDKVNPGDTLVAFRFMLNGRDITHIVAPNGGKDISLKQSTMALSNVAERNSGRFQENKAKNESLQAQINADEQKGELLEAEAAELSDAIDSTNQKIDDGQMTLDTLERKINEQNRYQEELQEQIDGYSAMNPQKAKYWYGLRTRPFDIASQPSGHTAYLKPEQAKARFSDNNLPRDYKFGAVGYQTPLSVSDMEHYSMSDLNTVLVGESELAAKGRQILSDAVDTWMGDKGVSSITKHDADNLLQAYQLSNGDNRTKLQSILSHQLREQPEFLDRREKPDEYKTWLSALETITEKDLERALDERVATSQPVVQDFNKERDQIEALRESLAKKRISLKAAKDAFSQIVSTLPDSLKREASDVQLANRSARYQEYLTSFNNRLDEFDPQAPVVTTDDGSIDFNEMTYDSMDEHSMFGKTLAQAAKINPQAVVDYLRDGSTWMSNYSAELLQAAADAAAKHYLPPTDDPVQDANIGREWDAAEGKASITDKWEEGYVVKYEGTETPEIIAPEDLEETIRRDQSAWEEAQKPEQDPNMNREWNSTKGKAQITGVDTADVIPGYLITYENDEQQTIVDQASIDEFIAQEEAAWEKAIKSEDNGEVDFTSMKGANSTNLDEYIENNFPYGTQEFKDLIPSNLTKEQSTAAVQGTYDLYKEYSESAMAHGYPMTKSMGEQMFAHYLNLSDWDIRTISNAGMAEGVNHNYGIDFEKMLKKETTQGEVMEFLRKAQGLGESNADEPTQEQTFVNQLTEIREGQNTDIDQGIEIMEQAYSYFEQNDLLDEYMPLLEAAADAHTEMMDQEVA